MNSTDRNRRANRIVATVIIISVLVGVITGVVFDHALIGVLGAKVAFAIGSVSVVAYRDYMWNRTLDLRYN